MTSRDFAYWLQGYFEIANPKTIGIDEIKAIKAHLSLVFVHEIDPEINSTHTASEIQVMNENHDWNKPPHLMTQDPSKPVMRC